MLSELSSLATQVLTGFWHSPGCKNRRPALACLWPLHPQWTCLQTRASLNTYTYTGIPLHPLTKSSSCLKSFENLMHFHSRKSQNTFLLLLLLLFTNVQFPNHNWTTTSSSLNFSTLALRSSIFLCIPGSRKNELTQDYWSVIQQAGMW